METKCIVIENRKIIYRETWSHQKKEQLGKFYMEGQIAGEEEKDKDKMVVDSRNGLHINNMYK